METLTPDQIDKRHLCIRAIGLIARQIACAAEGDLARVLLHVRHELGDTRRIDLRVVHTPA